MSDCRKILTWLVLCLFLAGLPAFAAEEGGGGAGKAESKSGGAPAAELSFPPSLPGGQEIVTVTSEELLKPPMTLRRRGRRGQNAPDDRPDVLPGAGLSGETLVRVGR